MTARCKVRTKVTISSYFNDINCKHFDSLVDIQALMPTFGDLLSTKALVSSLDGVVVNHCRRRFEFRVSSSFCLVRINDLFSHGL